MGSEGNGNSVEEFNRFRDKMNQRILSGGNLQIKRFFNLDDRAYEEGQLTRREKEMLGLVASLVLRCDECIKYHLQELNKINMSEGELWEILNVGLIVGGSIVIPHLREAVSFWDDLQKEENKNESEDCCASSPVKIYTDGACAGNPGPGGYAALIICQGDLRKKVSGGEKSTTNNRMEMKAVIEALKLIEEGNEVIIYCDSQYVVKGMKEWLSSWRENGWKTASGNPIKNRSMWKELDKLKERFNLEIKKVEAHSDNTWNNRADELARNSIPEPGKVDSKNKDDTEN